VGQARAETDAELQATAALRYLGTTVLVAKLIDSIGALVAS
jgi:hypothetical protein